MQLGEIRFAIKLKSGNLYPEPDKYNSKPRLYLYKTYHQANNSAAYHEGTVAVVKLVEVEFK